MQRPRVVGIGRREQVGRRALLDLQAQHLAPGEAERHVDAVVGTSKAGSIAVKASVSEEAA